MKLLMSDKLKKTNLSIHALRLILQALQIVVLIGLVPSIAQAYTGVTVVMSKASPANQVFVDELATQLANTQENRLRLSVKTITSGNRLVVAENSELVVALGAQAFEAAAKLSTTTPVLGVKVTLEDLQDVQEKSKRNKNNITAITLNQPNNRVVNLLKLALPEAKRIGVLVGLNGILNGEVLRTAAQKMGVNIVLEQVNYQVDLMQKLAEVLTKSDALLAYPDTETFNRDTAPAIFLSCYQNKKPVIGYSQSSVTAGALVAVYSDGKHLAQQVAEIAEQNKKANMTLPAPQPPKYFSVQVNKQVARLLNINILDEKILQQKMLDADVLNLE